MEREEHIFGELRSLFAQQPSEECFDAVCKVLGNTPVEEHVLHYVQEHLGTWPEHIHRRVPMTWLWQLYTTKRCPQIRLCNTLNFLNEDPGASPYYYREEVMFADERWEYTSHEYEPEGDRYEDMEGVIFEGDVTGDARRMGYDAYSAERVFHDSNDDEHAMQGAQRLDLHEPTGDPIHGGEISQEEIRLGYEEYATSCEEFLDEDDIPF